MSKGVQFLMKKNKIDVVFGFGKLKSKGVVEVKAADGSTKQILPPKYYTGYRRPLARVAKP
jgi:pyruvate/2-oxoglutarate dehydrogenase complex dihydrolipoamide dehydrogenase (E3) component